jgi:glycosyltransferase involved in cell wall biosynthesis
MKRPTVLLLGPDRGVISGVATHLNLLLGSALARRFDIVHFQVGSEGRRENKLALALRLLASPLRLAAAILKSGASVVHLNPSLNPKAFWRDLPHLLAAKLCGARVIYQVHGGSASEMNPAVLRGALALPDAVVVLSRCELDALQRLLPRQNILLVPNAIDCTPFLRPRAAGGPLRLFHIGRLVATKGAFETVQALARVRELGVDATLTIAGDGPALPQLREMVTRLGLETHVIFAGPTFGERKVELTCAADLLLLPTYHSEGLPYALLEGMAAGLVPIVTRIAAIPDVVSEGVHGLFVPPRDPEAIAQAIVRLARDRAALERMSVRCRERALSAYSIERLADDFTALYSSIGGSAAPRTAP